MVSSPRPVMITIYSKEDCGLCTKLCQRIEGLKDERIAQLPPFAIEKIDITSDQNLYNKYQFSIPVVFINGVYWRQAVTLQKFENDVNNFVDIMLQSYNDQFKSNS